MASNGVDEVEKVLKELLDALGVTHSGIKREEIAGQHILSIQTEQAPILIGGRGDTIYALDFLVKKIMEKRMPPLEPGAERSGDGRFLIDVNDYQVKRIKELQTKAIMMAERARSFQYDVELTPMSAYERLIVHTTLQDQPNVKTESQGDGRNRRVVIKYTA